MNTSGEEAEDQTTGVKPGQYIVHKPSLNALQRQWPNRGLVQRLRPVHSQLTATHRQRGNRRGRVVEQEVSQDRGFGALVSFQGRWLQQVQSQGGPSVGIWHM